MPERPQDFALVIGIQHYPAYQPLQGAVEDAKDVAAWLTDQTTGGGLKADHCHLLTSTEDIPPHPFWDEIDVALEKIEQEVQVAGGARRFYLYFSGHGHGTNSEDIYLCLGRWSAAKASRVALSATEYYRYAVNCLAFKEVVVLLDCCRVRVVNALGEAPGVSCVRPVAGAGTTKLFKAYATEFQNASYEAAMAPEGSGDPPTIRGHFTRALLAALKGGAADPVGGVKPSDLVAYLKTWVPRLALQSNHNQTPHIPQQELPDEPGSYFGNALPTAPANFTVRFKPGRTGEAILIGPNGDELQRQSMTAGDWVLTLSEGLHILKDSSGNYLTHFYFKPQEAKTDVEV